jgi:hypothetical protein
MGVVQQPFWKTVSQDYNWLIHRILISTLQELIPQHACGRLVDIGCGRKIWAPLLHPYVEDHIGVEHPETQHDLSRADVVASAYTTSLPDQPQIRSGARQSWSI